MKFTTVDTPGGPFSWLTSSGMVIASGWTTLPAYLIELAGLRPGKGPAPTVDELNRDDETARAVSDFFAGEISSLDRVAVSQRSGAFVERAWQVLRTVPAGHTVTYTELAAMAGRPTAVRAAATACASNRCALFVPCHRVLRSDGTLGGFRYGLQVKRTLLDFEAQGTMRIPGEENGILGHDD